MYGAPLKPSQSFCFKDTKNFAALVFFLATCNKNSSGQMRQIWRRMEMIHPTIGWRRDETGTHKHAHESWILWSVSRVRSKTMHSLSCITSWLPYITLCLIHRFEIFLPLEQSRMALSGCRLAASRLREAVRWQLLGKGWWCWGKGGGGRGCFQMGIILDGRWRYRIIVSSHLNNHLRQEHTMFTPHQNPTPNWFIHMARRFMSMPLPESE